MAIFSATVGAAVTLPLTVRDNTGALTTVTDARYQLRNSVGTVIRPFPGSGTDFTQRAVGIYEATITAPSTVDAYAVEYEATVAGTLTQGDPDVLLTVAPGPASVSGVVS